MNGGVRSATNSVIAKWWASTGAIQPSSVHSTRHVSALAIEFTVEI